MAANSSLNLTSLDFDSLKNNFVTYLKSQDVFKDYNFEGSNMNVLLDVMTYNTFLNSFYLNMVASEMFMDSAQKLDSVVSHAKELNYVPQSYKSSVAFVGMTIQTTGITSKLVIPKGIIFSGVNSNGSFSFTTAEQTTYTSPNSTFTVANLAIYEGTYVTDTFAIDSTIESQKFVLSNPSIDIGSLTVSVVENNDSLNPITFNRVSTLFSLSSNSNVYFLQSAQAGKYEILFGDNVLGRIPQNGAVINANYRISNGPLADGITNFACNQDLGEYQNNGGEATIDTVVTNVMSSSGGSPENIETIRFRAPRYFATQQRAVATDDYSSLILTEFGGQVSDINVYGGETVEPKQYGRVIVCIKPKGTLIAPDYLKTEIVNFLKPYIAVPARVITADPEYLYLKVHSTVQYDPYLTNKLPNDLKTDVITTISSYSANYLEVFKNDFRYSRFVNQIDNTDASITSNDTDILLIKRISPYLGVYTDYNIEFNNPSEREGFYDGKLYPDEPTLYSSKFSYVNADGYQHNDCYLRDNGAGVIYIYKTVNNQKVVVNENAGSINYDTGLVSLNKFNALNFDSYISVYYVPKSSDLYASGNKIILIDPSDVTVDIITKRD